MTTDRVLVLGATGFIGRHVVDRVAADGVTVFCPIITSRGQGSRSPVGDGIVPIEMSVLDEAQLARAIQEVAPQVVINLAAAGVDPADRTTDLLDGNAGIVSRLLTAAMTRPPRLVIHAGTWSEYADPVGDALLDEDHPVRPRSVYGAAKAAAEMYGAALAGQLGLAFVTLRLFNVYGAGEAPHRLLPHLVSRLAREEPVELTSGEQTRDFVHVSDAADAFATVMSARRITDHAAYNVCSGRGTTVRAFAEMVADTIGAPRELLRFGALPSRSDEPGHIVGDPTRLARATGWRTTIGVPEGIERSVAAMQGNAFSRDR